jgi:signal transduction histidine kinase
VSQALPLPPARQARPYQGGFLIGCLLLAVAALRALIFYRGQPPLAQVLLLLAAYGLLYGAEPLLSPRWPWVRFLYFPLQTALLLVVTNVRPFLDNTCSLYIPLAMQALHAFSRRVAVFWMLLFSVLLMLTLILGVGWADGIGLGLVMLGGGVFLISYDLLYLRTRADQAESQVLLTELQAAHQKLQEHAALAEELAAARERNRLARELHDSVSQVIFGIALTAQSARLLLERDPARVPEQLDRLEEMTGSALSRLRALIAQLRPPPESVGYPP